MEAAKRKADAGMLDRQEVRQMNVADSSFVHERTPSNERMK